MKNIITNFNCFLNENDSYYTDSTPSHEEHGIVCSTNDMLDLSNDLELNAIDEYIPLPNLDTYEQQERISDCEDHSVEVTFWENENGGHGYCCKNCGKVVQWG